MALAAGAQEVVSLLRKNLQQEEQTAQQLEQLAAQQLALLAPQLVEIVQRIEGARGASVSGGGLPDGAAEDATAEDGEDVDVGLNISYGALQDETESPLSGGDHVP